jgi:hypothetical protein
MTVQPHEYQTFVIRRLPHGRLVMVECKATPSPYMEGWWFQDFVKPLPGPKPYGRGAIGTHPRSYGRYNRAISNLSVGHSVPFRDLLNCEEAVEQLAQMRMGTRWRLGDDYRVR